MTSDGGSVHPHGDASFRPFQHFQKPGNLASDNKSLTNGGEGQCSTTSSAPQREGKEENRRRISPRRRPPRRVEEDYDIRDLLGSGTVGEVRRAIHRQTGQECAIKIMTLASGRTFAGGGGAWGRQNPEDQQRRLQEAQATLRAEAAILQGLEHPYVVKLLDVYVSNTAVYLVMELVQGGDLFDRILAKGRYTEVESRRVMRRLLSAIAYLHLERNIVHRDLKPENILCMHPAPNDIQIKLTDFGLAKVLEGEEDGLKTFCGTPQYFAPEVLRRRHTVKGKGRYGKQADMWSLGVILYVLLSGTPPFDVSSMDVVEDVEIDFPDEFWTGISQGARDLVLCLLRSNPKERYTVQQACNHPWVLMADGDTHTHPLDDPLLDSSKKRLFPVSHVEMEDPSAKSAPLETKEEEELVSRISKKSYPRELVDAQAAGEPTQCKAAEHESVEEKLVEEKVINDGKHVELQVETGVTEEHAKLDDCDPRRPLSPVSLNNGSSGKPDNLDAVAEKPPAHAFVHIEYARKNESVTSTTKTPRHNNHRRGPAPSVTPAAPAESLELSDDEILSDFSDRTESISSFTSTTTVERHSCSTSNDDDEAIDMDRLPQKRNRRVTQSMDKGVVAIKGSVSRSEMATSERKRKAVQAGSGNKKKQLKLSNWSSKIKDQA